MTAFKSDPATWQARPAGVVSPPQTLTHFHMLWLDGVYEPVAARPDKPRDRGATSPHSVILGQWGSGMATRQFDQKINSVA